LTSTLKPWAAVFSGNVQSSEKAAGKQGKLTRELTGDSQDSTAALLLVYWVGKVN
jgi:hypothetical protein